MIPGSWPEFLGVLGATVLLYSIHRICRPGSGRRVRPSRLARQRQHWAAEWRSLRADVDDLNLAYRQSLRQRDPAPLLACRDLMLRARSASSDASPDGAAAAPAAAAVPLNAERSERWWLS